MQSRSQPQALIIAPALDIHAFAVRHAAEIIGLEVIILDTANFPTEISLSIEVSDDLLSASIGHVGRSTIILEQVAGIWWRRPNKPVIADSLEVQFVGAASIECREAIFGSLNATIDNMFNNPGASRFADQKLVQLARARAFGFKIPVTLCTTRAELAADFYKIHRGNVVYRIFKGSGYGFYPTRMMSEDDYNRLSELEFCPCIMQSAVKGDFDVRATIVGGDVFATRIDFDKHSDIIDTINEQFYTILRWMQQTDFSDTFDSSEPGRTGQDRLTGTRLPGGGNRAPKTTISLSRDGRVTASLRSFIRYRGVAPLFIPSMGALQILSGK